MFKKQKYNKWRDKPKNRFEEQKYTYKIKGKKSLRSLKEKEKNTRPKTYVEQIEEQRNRVRSQILKHM